MVMEVVCLCEMGGEGNVLLLSTCTGCHGIVMALLGLVALSLLCPYLS